jgi:hypothetical protein
MTTKRLALGRGLAALIPGAAEAPAPAFSEAELRPVEPPREGLRKVGIEEVHPAGPARRAA